jgi:hypothetical protein
MDSKFYVLFPLISADGSQTTAEAAWAEENISYVGTVRFPSLEPMCQWDRHSAKDAIRSARERAGWPRI